MGKVVYILLFILLVTSIFAHTNHSGELGTNPVLVRVIDISGDNYEMSCSVPADSSQLRLWSIRVSGGEVVDSAKSTDSSYVFTFDRNTMYHIECGVLDTDGKYIAMDFHVDLRTQVDENDVQIYVHEGYDLTVNATCLPPTGTTNYDLKWFWNHQSSNIPLSDYSNQNDIQVDAPGYGLWELACGTYNFDEVNESKRWVQHSLTLEFFENSKPYIPRPDGCMPWENCPELGTQQTVPTQTIPKPVWLEPTQNDNTIDPFDFHINTFDLDNSDHVASDFEIWDVASNTLVWISVYNTDILYHIHNADGEFIDSNDIELKENTQYKVRSRFHFDSVGPWSEWVYFGTSTRPNVIPTSDEWTVAPGYVLEKVVSQINLPTVIDGAPDIYVTQLYGTRPKLYVTELYGDIGVVLNDGTYKKYATDLLNFDDFGSFPGAGEIGLTGLYVDETTGDLFVTVVYVHPQNGPTARVERFITNEQGDSFTSRQIILDDIPIASSHQTQKLTRGPDGKLYLNVGDDHHEFRSTDLSYLTGKILRFNDDGSMPNDNPYPGTYVYAMGFRNPFGGDFRPGTSEYYVTNNGPDSNDGIFKVEGGEEFGWCCDTASGTWHLWEETVAPTGLVWDDGSSIFDTYDTLYVALSGKTYEKGPGTRGKRVSQFDSSGNFVKDLVAYTGSGHGTAIDVSFLSDGLYFTDIYGKDGFVGFGETKGNIYRVVPQEYASEQTEETVEFAAGIGMKKWYPQGTTVIWECKGIEGSGNYKYSFSYGDGKQTGQLNSPDSYHVYPRNGTYSASCTVYDQDTGKQATVTTQLVLGSTQQVFTLSVDANVQADIYVDSVLIGQTPVESQLAPGIYDITFKALGYTDVVRSVDMLNDIDLFETLTDSHTDHDHYHIASGQPVPAVAISYDETNLILNTTNFAFFEPPGQFGSHTQGQGHAHWYLDGTKVGRIYTPIFPIPLDPGVYDITVRLATNNHLEYLYNGDFIEDSISVSIGQYCPTSVFDSPVTCSGTVQTENVKGCLQVTCTQGIDYLRVLACNKQDNFEMYYKASLGNVGDICIGDTCMNKNAGFVASNGFCSEPRNTSDNTEPPVEPPVEPPIEPPVEPPVVSEDLEIAKWYPKGTHYVFKCGLTGSSFEWRFGDGQKQLSGNADVYHKYASSGDYTVTCANGNEIASLDVKVI